MTNAGVISTNHTSFTVSDLDRSIAFFRDILGFTATSKLPRYKSVIQSITGVSESDVMIAYLHGPGHTLELIEYLAPPDRSEVRPRPCDVGFAHIAFDVEDIDAIVTLASEHNVFPIGQITTVDQGPNQGGKAVYLRDSDGITVELIQKPVTSSR
jgi:catechol 2,3-dioxygenase-like lactoylglutathione lyase family enzyme